MRLKYVAVAAGPPCRTRRSRPDRDARDFTVGDIRIEGLQRITRRHGLQLPAGQHRRPARPAPRRRGAARAVRDRLLPRRRAAPRRRHAAWWSCSSARRSRASRSRATRTSRPRTWRSRCATSASPRGKTFNQSTLDEVERFLTDQYFSRGKYGVQVDTKVEELPDNRVKIAIDIVEGKRSKIRQINIVGNEAFSDEDLLEEFKLQTPNWLSWYKQDDRYSREELSGDIEKLRSYYLDRGYANIDVESTQVAIAPEKDDIFITLNVKEGEVYRISDVKIAGNLVVPEEELKALVAGAPRRRVLAQDDHRDHRADGAAPRPGRLRLRQDRSGAEGERRDEGDRADVPRRSGQSRLRAQHQLHRHAPASTTTCCVARCARWKAATCRTRRSSAPSSACSACRSSRRSKSRPTRCRARPTWSTSTTRSRKACRASSAAASATRSRSRSC